MTTKFERGSKDDTHLSFETSAFWFTLLMEKSNLTNVN